MQVGLPTVPICPGHPDLWVILICPVRDSSSPVFQSQPRRPIIGYCKRAKTHANVAMGHGCCLLVTVCVNWPLDWPPLWLRDCCYNYLSSRLNDVEGHIWPTGHEFDTSFQRRMFSLVTSAEVGDVFCLSFGLCR